MTKKEERTKGKERERLMALVFAVAGIGVLLSPLPNATKLIVGLSGSGLCALQAIDIKESRHRDALRKLDREAELNQKEILLEAKYKELDAALILLETKEAEIASKKRTIETEIGLAKKELEAELARDRDRFRRKLEHDENMFRDELKQVQELELSRLKKESEILRQQIEQLESDRALKLQQIAIEAGQLKDELKEELDILEEELEEIRAAKINEIETEVKKLWDAWEKERESKRAADAKELEEAEEALANQFVENRDQLIVELEELKTSLRKEAEQNYENWLVPHCQEMDEKIREIEALKATIQMLREQIAESRDIKLSGQDGTEWGDRSDKVLLWLKENGIPCDYCNSDILPDGRFVLNFMPWVVGKKTESALKGLLIWMIDKFGLKEIPVLEPNGYARAWRLTMVSVHTRINGRSPNVDLHRMDQFYTQQVPEIEQMRVGETFKDIEPEIRRGVAQQLNYQQQVAEMMAFKPSILPKPRTQQITELELVTCKWFFFWRALATDGDQPNVTTREGLLWHVYGVREGRASSSYDSLMCESLGQRVKRILDILKVESTELENNEE
jgi:hypothetical protein